MAFRVCILGAGLMGSAIAARLCEHGVDVTTVVEGRSTESRERARLSGMRAVSIEAAFDTDLLLSIVPPAQAVDVAREYAAAAKSGHRPIYVDCNAVSPATVGVIAEIIAAADIPFVDACIIGGPPAPGRRGPAGYASGEHAGDVAALARFGVRMSVLDGPIGTASALKMCYGGILKGVTAVGAAMILTAGRSGVADALHAEISDSMPEILSFLQTVLPNMPSRAHRWVAEMEEVADFIGAPLAEQQAYQSIAEIYERLAASQAGDRAELLQLNSFLEKRRGP